MGMPPRDLRHVVADNPRVLIVESSKMVRKLISDLLKKELPNVTIVESTGLKQARACLDLGAVDLVTTSLSLDDGDGLQVAKAVRDAAGQAYVPVIVVSSEVNSRLASRTLGDDVTDYFDKSAGFPALAAFVRGYIQPQPIDGARILYVEDSRVVALATKRMLAAQGLTVIHVDSAEAAIEYLDLHRGAVDEVGADLILTDVYLNGPLGGLDVLKHVRQTLGYSKRLLPALVMTGDENPDKQRELFQVGANDLVLKPVEERMVVTKILFQLRAARLGS